MREIAGREHPGNGVEGAEAGIGEHGAAQGEGGSVGEAREEHGARVKGVLSAQASDELEEGPEIRGGIHDGPGLSQRGGGEEEETPAPGLAHPCPDMVPAVAVAAVKGHHQGPRAGDASGNVERGAPAGVRVVSGSQVHEGITLVVDPGSRMDGGITPAADPGPQFLPEMGVSVWKVMPQSEEELEGLVHLSPRAHGIYQPCPQVALGGV